MSVRVLLVDDDPLVCRGLELLLDADPEITVVGSVPWKYRPPLRAPDKPRRR